MPPKWTRGADPGAEDPAVSMTPPASPSKRIDGLPNTSLQDVHMMTAKMTLNDVHMETARGGTTRKGAGLQLWEREKLNTPEVKRKAVVAQMCKFVCLSAIANF